MSKSYLKNKLILKEMWYHWIPVRLRSKSERKIHFQNNGAKVNFSNHHIWLLRLLIKTHWTFDSKTAQSIERNNHQTIETAKKYSLTCQLITWIFSQIRFKKFKLMLQNLRKKKFIWRNPIKKWRKASNFCKNGLCKRSTIQIHSLNCTEVLNSLPKELLKCPYSLKSSHW